MNEYEDVQFELPVFDEMFFFVPSRLLWDKSVDSVGDVEE